MNEYVGYHAKQNKLSTEKQISYDLTDMCDLKTLNSQKPRGEEWSPMTREEEFNSYKDSPTHGE